MNILRVKAPSCLIEMKPHNKESIPKACPTCQAEMTCL